MGTKLGAELGADLGIGFLVGAAKLAVDPITGLAITALAANSDKVSGAARKTYARLLNGSAPPQDSNHILFNMIHKARWQAVAQVLISCDRDFPAMCRLDQDHNLKRIFDISIEQHALDIGSKLDPKDETKARYASRPKNWLNRLMGRNTGQRDAEETFSPHCREISHALPALLARDPRNQTADPHARAKHEAALDAANKDATEKMLTDIWAITRTFSESGVPRDFLARFRDPQAGWGAQFRVALKAYLDDPDHGATAKRLLINLAAETHAAVVDLTTLTAGIDAKVTALIGHMSAIQSRLDHIDTRLIDILQRLNPPLRLAPTGHDGTDSITFLKLVYTARQTALIGRDAEIGRAADQGILDHFMNRDQRFCWWQIAGDGGQGKSRLALELIERYGEDWHAGFLRGHDLFQVDWAAVQFERPTLIVIDDVAAPKKADAVGRAIRALYDRFGAAQSTNPGEPRGRLLIVERAGFTFEEATQVQPQWFRDVLNGNARAVSGACFDARSPLTLSDYSADTMLAIAQSWRQSQGNAPLNAEQEKRLLEKWGMAETRRKTATVPAGRFLPWCLPIMWRTIRVRS